MNKSYVKQLSADGTMVINPLRKNKPIIHHGKNRKQRRAEARKARKKKK